MIYALDTNIISYILRGDKNLKERLRQEEKKGNRSVIPLMVYYEVKRGLLASGATIKMQSFEDLCAVWGIHDLTKADMNTAAAIYADRKRKGTPIYDSDLLIAAQCSANGYTLVTHNTKHFEGIDGLTIVDWYE
ncbi:MAG: type II toxin-antitoxin system VapC family toxin [Oscillospiraceae bacterium]|nr:type II toxin-antitoxin system VapC family toxin [Oscillospiraceae bacterium]